MHTFTKELTICLTVNFTDDELKQMIEKYKEDCKKYHIDIENKDNLEMFLDDEFWNMNDYSVMDSKSNINDFYDEVWKFL